MNHHRVVITGLGAVSPLGVGAPRTFERLLAGESGLGPYTLLDPEAEGLASRAVGEVTDFNAEDHFERREARRMDRVMHFARVAAKEALNDAGLIDGAGDLNADLADPDCVGVFIGTGTGGVTTLMNEEGTRRERGARRVSPFLLPMFLSDSIPGSVAIAHGLKGPNMAHLSACASGANAIGEAAEAIRRGAADVMVAGGSEAPIVPVVVAGFENMGALSTFSGDPAKASRPFDAERDGFVMGEGAAVVILERRDLALARGAPIYAELVGYGSSADAEHVTAPAEDGGGIRRAIWAALDQAGMRPDAIEYVNAHGTSTPLNDAVETLALKAILGDRAYDVPVSSNKSMTGHLLGAGGALEGLATALTIHRGQIPPTINREHPDPDCDLDYVTEGARDRPVSVALSISLGFGGHNAALLFAADDGEPE